MILVEECKLRLDDPVDEWLPELKNRKVLRSIESPLDDTVPAKRPITLRDLLTFRSGHGEVVFLSPLFPIQKAMAEAGLPLSVWLFAATPDGAFGTSWYVDPKEELVGVFMSQRTPDSLSLPAAELDFWTSAYQLIDD